MRLGVWGLGLIGLRSVVWASCLESGVWGRGNKAWVRGFELRAARCSFQASGFWASDVFGFWVSVFWGFRVSGFRV